jgi:hypothetical protein
LDICDKAFGQPPSKVVSNIQHAKALYGGANIQSSRIMFTNGEIDPWQANGVLSSPNDQEPTLMVAGASHHFWTHPSLPTDTVEVRNARETIWNQVRPRPHSLCCCAILYGAMLCYAVCTVLHCVLSLYHVLFCFFLTFFFLIFSLVCVCYCRWVSG